MAKLILGCGYLGLRVARLWLQDGAEVFALTRSSRRADEFRQCGLWPLVGDVTSPDTLPNFPTAETVLIAIGHDKRAGKPIQEVYVAGLRHVLDRLPRETRRLIYISSTGVYGPSPDDWVDEQTPCHPVRAGGRACLAAERLLQASPWSDRTIVLRLAGIYGPGRIPRRRELSAGRPIDAPAEGYVNLIHVEDAAAAVLVAERQGPTPALYCLSDGQPVDRRAYYAELAQLLGAPEPRFVPPPPDSAAAERAGASKRIRPARFLSEFAFRLAYPSYRQGLAAILREEQGTE